MTKLPRLTPAHYLGNSKNGHQHSHVVCCRVSIQPLQKTRRPVAMGDHAPSTIWPRRPNAASHRFSKNNYRKELHVCIYYLYTQSISRPVKPVPADSCPQRHDKCSRTLKCSNESSRCRGKPLRATESICATAQPHPSPDTQPLGRLPWSASSGTLPSPLR